VKKEFKSIPIIEVENKVDLERSKSGRVKISASTGKGVSDLVDSIIAVLPHQQRL